MTRIERVTAVIPCRNNPEQARAAIDALARVDARGRSLDAVLVDDASDPAISLESRPGAIDVRVLRLDEQRGGSGAFNAGMRAAMASPHPPDALWLLDSDAMASPGSLHPLASALDDDAIAIAAGSALRDPACGHVYEAGGRIGRWSGVATPCAPAGPRRVEYAAACSLLIRAAALRSAGLFPEIFISHDDIAWCLEAARRVGGHVLAVPESVVDHPWQRVHVAGRYYASRNGWLALSHRDIFARAGRAAVETLLAVGASIEFGREVGSLHVAGWRDAAAGAWNRRCPQPLPTAPPLLPIDGSDDQPMTLPDRATWTVHPHLTPWSRRLGVGDASSATPPRSHARIALGDLLAFAKRLVAGPTEGCIVAPAAWPFAWARRRTVVHPSGHRLLMITPDVGGNVLPALAQAIRGWPHLARLIVRGCPRPDLPPLVSESSPPRPGAPR